jgi:heme/copper-type cytochrome/quinol oxidase subunit 2
LVTAEDTEFVSSGSDDSSDFTAARASIDVSDGEVGSAEPELSRKAFDSYMVLEEDLELGQHRLLEVDNQLVLPSWTQIRFLITSDDVIHA